MSNHRVILHRGHKGTRIYDHRDPNGASMRADALAELHHADAITVGNDLVVDASKYYNAKTIRIAKERYALDLAESYDSGACGADMCDEEYFIEQALRNAATAYRARSGETS